MYDYFKFGDTVYGFCNGYFGKDKHGEKLCILVMKDYAVFEYEKKEVLILYLDCFSIPNTTMVNRWKVAK